MNEDNSKQRSEIEGGGSSSQPGPSGMVSERVHRAGENTHTRQPHVNQNERENIPREIENMKAELSRLEARRESFLRKMRFLVVEIFFIFAVPAIAAVFLGRLFDDSRDCIERGVELTCGHSSFYLYIFLAVAFILSWIIVLLRYRQVSAQQAATQSRIQELRAILGVSEKDFKKSSETT